MIIVAMMAAVLPTMPVAAQAERQTTQAAKAAQTVQIANNVNTENRCFDYLDIDGETGHAGVCYYADFNTYVRNNSGNGTMGRVDYGSADERSMHTVHTDAGETDAHTGGILHTVPDGEKASVRLGAYSMSGQSARIEYMYPVEANVSDILKMRYAVVMQSGGHGSSLTGGGDMTPTFSMQILDDAGNEIDGCASVDFRPGVGDSTKWHAASKDWYWCEWQTMAVSLAAYAGQTLTIRLTAARCTYDTHPAYAYFTFDCGTGSMQKDLCCHDLVHSLEAPEGFTYRWYRQADTLRTTVSTDRVMDITADDDAVYMVECHSTAIPECFFTLTVNPNPYCIEAIVAADVSDDNTVTFTNRSLRRNYSRADGSLLDAEPVWPVVYDYGDGSEIALVEDSVVSHTYPYCGGVFRFTAIAATATMECADTLNLYIILPDLQAGSSPQPERTDTIPMQVEANDGPEGSTVDPIDPNQVVVTIQGNELTISEHVGEELTYTLLKHAPGNAPARHNLSEPSNAPMQHFAPLEDTFRESVSLQLTEDGTYTLRISSPAWNYSLTATFTYIHSALPSTRADASAAPRKILRDGQLLIRQGERLFTPTGMQVGIIVPTDDTD